MLSYKDLRKENSAPTNRENALPVSEEDVPCPDDLNPHDGVDVKNRRLIHKDGSEEIVHDHSLNHIKTYEDETDEFRQQNGLDVPGL